jgi:hypothetical protein
MSAMSIDKVTIQGVEFTRVDGQYLLQSEVEETLQRFRQSPAPHVMRLTSLLEDIVASADTVALQVAEAQLRERIPPTAQRERTNHNTLHAAREILLKVRENLQEQILLIDSFLQQLED